MVGKIRALRTRILREADGPDSAGLRLDFGEAMRIFVGEARGREGKLRQRGRAVVLGRILRWSIVLGIFPRATALY